ncbi:MAG: META domain-containing protein [Croceivirga sp.]
MRRLLFALFIVVSLFGYQSCNTEDEGPNNNAVLGTWRIIEVQVSQQQLAQFSPSDEDIVFMFTSEGNFSGSTSVNQFNGRYELDGTTLTMLEFTTTEVADTPFAISFYDAIAEAQVPDETFAQFGFSFESQNLILVFGNSGRMVLELQS